MLNSIFNSVLLLIVALLLFSSQKMKSGNTLAIKIDWQSSSLYDFSFDGAIYPDEFQGLPATSIVVTDVTINDFKVTKLSKKPISSSKFEFINSRFPDEGNLLRLKKYIDRGNEVAYLTVFPFLFDSLSNTYFQVEYIEVNLVKSPHRSNQSNLRTSVSEGNSIL